MARLFIRHKPVDTPITEGYAPGIFTTKAEYLPALGISLVNADMDFTYVCVVHNGRCWAARNFHIHTNGAMLRINCVPFDHDPSGREMVLADMILN